jgi:hypothetical protein
MRKLQRQKARGTRDGREEGNGRQFEGMIVYDDSVKQKRPAFMQPD